jgi:thiamine-monophosphate kinase
LCQFYCSPEFVFQLTSAGLRRLDFEDFTRLPLPEKQLIDRVRLAAGRIPLPAHGIGDDCAVLAVPPGHETLITTDFSLENTHFRREWHPADSVGHRCLARGLSDIAAMGGTPRAAFLSLALPRELPQRWVDKFFAGFLKLAKSFSVQLAGGDIAQSPDGVLADIMVLGTIPKGRAILRSGARAGDFVYVTGTLGSSVAALEQLRHGKKLRTSVHPRYFYPEPRITIGRYLREKNLASSMIDTSDGLSTDLLHICDESGVGAVIYAESLPRTRDAKGLEFALHGGEDYELLFTAPPNRRVPSEIAAVPIARIGEIVSGNSLRLADVDGKVRRLKVKGWEHFR